MRGRLLGRAGCVLAALGIAWLHGDAGGRIAAAPPPPPGPDLIADGDFAAGLGAWSAWVERGRPSLGEDGGALLARGDGYNAGVFQSFATGGAGVQIEVAGTWRTDPAAAGQQWAEVLVIHGPRRPRAGEDVMDGQADVELLYKNDTWAAPGGWSGSWAGSATTARARFVARAGEATIVLKSGNAGGTTTGVRFDDVTVRPVAPPPPPPPAPSVPPGTNVAPAAAGFAASSRFGPAWDGQAAFDRVTSPLSKWVSDGAAPESWLALDLGRRETVTGFVVRHAGAAGEWPVFNLSRFRLEAGDSLGGPWAVLHRVDNAAGDDVSTVVLARPAATRYVRIHVEDAGADDHARLPELEVYSTGPAAPPGGGGAPTVQRVTVPPGDPLPDYAALRAQLAARGQRLAHVKIGFHVGPGGNQRGIGDYMRRLDAAGVPFVIKSADSAGQILEGARLRAASGVPHVLVYRRSTGSGWSSDVPDYDMPPLDAAREHWRRHRAEFPPELEPYKDTIWIETINEVDKNRAEWLGEFAFHTASLAMAEGFRWAAFGWSSGEPERAHWEGPWMRRFLELAGRNPDRVAVALHEYSYVDGSLDRLFPHLVGRFGALFEVCDRLAIPRPTVHVTEFGWTYQQTPGPAQAFGVDLPWAAEVYAPHPQVRGAAIWYLGPGFGGISDRAQRLIAPMIEFATRNYWVVTPR